MVDIVETLTSSLILIVTASFMIVITLIFSSFKPFNVPVSKKSLLAKVIVGIFLGLLAILGTLMGTKLADGTIVNVRELAANIAGLAGGPVGGVIAGLIGGIHRFTVGGATALPCTVSTVLIGLIAGAVSTKITGKWYLLKGAALGFVLESMAMILILILVPFTQAVAIVEKIAFPMITANTVGLVMWLYLANKLKQIEK